jgi:hypothetical protein
VSLQITLAAEAHLREGKYFPEEQTLKYHRKVSDILRRNSKANGIQNGRSEFRATVNLSEKECINVDASSSSVRCAILTDLKQACN